ncbi:hypothetical protein [Nonomuraea deserti]|uniref:hypothetical protein n=1 Tax=Nonomuraea deserti TaxID=1848322 RepID=UPI0014049962|nr:hypothetical protein [Nonomuraea deserti]
MIDLLAYEPRPCAVTVGFTGDARGPERVRRGPVRSPEAVIAGPFMAFTIADRADTGPSPP